MHAVPKQVPSQLALLFLQSPQVPSLEVGQKQVFSLQVAPVVPPAIAARDGSSRSRSVTFLMPSFVSFFMLFSFVVLQIEQFFLRSLLAIASLFP
jgi:hypothetical protein